ncbi:hypothetical protein F6476_22240 [Pseudomonas umsongensis]|uniref:hypothetical protein n=1 Tax=Pseudomonas umsongensis TaxID=198618 RepID=UPI0012455804|nr:hypothetical protein [Pseudomonas umsongensis]QFG31699.1 hypothetical protein F6476_22240 [Pseudomonas umsongensis]
MNKLNERKYGSSHPETSIKYCRVANLHPERNPLLKKVETSSTNHARNENTKRVLSNCAFLNNSYVSSKQTKNIKSSVFSKTDRPH